MNPNQSALIYMLAEATTRLPKYETGPTNEKIMPQLTPCNMAAIELVESVARELWKIAMEGETSEPAS